MDFSRIKNCIKKNGDKFILIENGEPEMVIMSFDEYEKIMGGSVDAIRWDQEEKNAFAGNSENSSSHESSKEDVFNNFISEVYGAPLNGHNEKPGDGKDEFALPANLDDNNFKDLRGVGNQDNFFSSASVAAHHAPPAAGEEMPFFSEEAPLSPDRNQEQVANPFFFTADNEKKDETIAESEKDNVYQFSDDREEAGLRLENVRLEDIPL